MLVTAIHGLHKIDHSDFGKSLLVSVVPLYIRLTFGLGFKNLLTMVWCLALVANISMLTL